MMHDYMHCIACSTPLTNGLDTWGEVGTEFCRDCYIAFWDTGPRTVFSQNKISIWTAGDSWIQHYKAPKRGRSD